MTDMIIFGKTKLADIVMQDRRALVLLPRFGIELGFGDRTVKQVCEDRNINTDFFMLMVNVFLNKKFFPDRKLKNVDIDMLLKYLENSHKYYLEEKIPYLETLIEEFISKVDHPATQQLEKFFHQYIVEVKEHLAYEDETAFPYAAALSEQIKKDPSNIADIDYHIGVFEERHDNIEEKLTDLKSLLIKYFPPSNDRYIRMRILNELIEFEDDLINHARIEDKVLIPIVEQLEKKIS
ncbi:MAG: hemerythrin domain-containing protein [Bacteroidetes bacterium]|nr:MAG: hemerythrin domain-containing protein [Bacteroidota bacterium]